MLINVSQSVALFAVPILIYSYAVVLSFFQLSVMLPKLFSRSLIKIPNFTYNRPYSSTDFVHYKNYYTSKYHPNGFCKNGEILNPENSTMYLRSSEGWLPDQNSSFVEIVAKRFHTVIMDCPDLFVLDFSFESKEAIYARILKHFKWIVAFNSHQNALGRQPTVKVWFRLSEGDNDATMHFNDYYCVALAMAGNRIHPGTVQGLVLNGKFLSSLKVDDLKIVTTFWKKTARRFGLKRLGLFLNHSRPALDCTDLKDSPLLTNDEILAKYNKMFYYTPGGAWIILDAGVSAITLSRYKDCKRLLTDSVPSGTKIHVTDVLERLDLLVGRGEETFCRIYHYDLYD